MKQQLLDISKIGGKKRKKKKEKTKKKNKKENKQTERSGWVSFSEKEGIQGGNYSVKKKITCIKSSASVKRHN